MRRVLSCLRMPHTPSPRPAAAPDGHSPHARAAPARRLGWRAMRLHLSQLSFTTQALLWSASAGLIFCFLNTLGRILTLQLDPLEAQFLRYLFGFIVMLPLVWRQGWRPFVPKHVSGQFLRGAVHTVGLMLWFIALPKIALADMTAIGFTGPIFIMIGAAMFLHEPMHWERWVATAIGVVGMVIVLGPKFSGGGGHYHLVMLASAPVFAASFLITKALTKYETAQVIVLWQAITVTLFSLPMALVHWQWPTLWQWAGFALCGLLGSVSHYCLTRSFAAADISATQSLKFLDLVWASLMGWLIFADVPTQTTLIGGAVICAGTLWVVRRESGRSKVVPIDDTI